MISFLLRTNVHYVSLLGLLILIAVAVGAFKRTLKPIPPITKVELDSELDKIHLV